MVKKRDISDKTEAAKRKKKEDLEMEEALNLMIQAARTKVEATQTEKTID